jgi:histidyl-tRNA synthetase
MKLQPVRGTRDIYGDQALLFQEIHDQFKHWARIFDFTPMETPIFEFSQVFQRSLGDETDIVNKEMYTFTDRSGDSLTLRPEGTASIARAIISNSLLRELPLKLYYSGPMFRHERPQKGRYRQFQQFGVELLGVDSALADLEVLSFAWAFFSGCGLADKVQLEINTLGDEESRSTYQKQLVDFFESCRSQLSPESQKRLDTNPLRILDSKEEEDQEWIQKAPALQDSLNSLSRDFFQQICDGLDQLSLSYQLNPRLVRGLDYYNHCVFEFTTSHLGSQNAVLSGGRYNNLVESLGGPSTPGVGWAAGMDRLALLMEAPQKPHHTVAIISSLPQQQSEGLPLLHKLRMEHIPSQIIYSGNMSKQLKKADKRGCSHAIIMGEKEQLSQSFSLKNFSTGEQTKLSFESLISELKQFYNVQ